MSILQNLGNGNDKHFEDFSRSTIDTCLAFVRWRGCILLQCTNRNCFITPCCYCAARERENSITTRVNGTVPAGQAVWKFLYKSWKTQPQSVGLAWEVTNCVPERVVCGNNVEQSFSFSFSGKSIATTKHRIVHSAIIFTAHEQAP